MVARMVRGLGPGERGMVADQWEKASEEEAGTPLTEREATPAESKVEPETVKEGEVARLGEERKMAGPEAAWREDWVEDQGLRKESAPETLRDRTR